MPKPRVSFVLATHNRRDVLLGTLAQIEQAGSYPGDFEILVVDDASTDGSADAVAKLFPSVRVIRRHVSAGPVCKNDALPVARGEYVVFLDDDSYPRPGSVARMIAHFEAHPRLGAAVFRVHLPDGREECSAYPDVFIGCGTGFRRDTLRQVGGLPRDFFMQAEEYDLSLRLLDAGWDVRRFDDLHVTHLKSPMARRSARTMELDVRNNLALIARHFPDRWIAPYTRDWLRRYYLIARSSGLLRAYWKGVARGLPQLARPRTPVRDETFERFAKVEEIRKRLARFVDQHCARRLLFIDLGKNVLAFRLAARECGVEVVAIADARLGGSGRRFFGIPLVGDEVARQIPFDAAVISNLSPVHASRRHERWERLTDKPILHV